MDREGFVIVEAVGRELKIESRFLAAQTQLPESAEGHRLIREQVFFLRVWRAGDHG